MEKTILKYQPTDILQIIQANYRQQQQHDPVVLKDQELTFDTTIFDWRDICDLVKIERLWLYLNQHFRMNIDWPTWKSVLEPEDEKTLKDLCTLIATHAESEIITSVKLFGTDCRTAAIFKTLTKKMKDRGIDISEIRPSSKLEPLVKKYRGILIEEINLLCPTVLPPINYQENWVYKWGLRACILFLFVTIFNYYQKNGWAWPSGAIAIIGYAMTWIGSRLNAKQANFAGIETVADLVRKINTASGGA